MLMSMHRWEEVRQWFNEDEKTQLTLAVTGDAICPRGLIVDDKKLSAALRAKLKLHFGETKVAAAS
jgi:hypothetical protein